MIMYSPLIVFLCFIPSIYVQRRYKLEFYDIQRGMDELKNVSTQQTQIREGRN